MATNFTLTPEIEPRDAVTIFHSQLLAAHNTAAALRERGYCTPTFRRVAAQLSRMLGEVDKISQ